MLFFERTSSMKFLSLKSATLIILFSAITSNSALAMDKETNDSTKKCSNSFCEKLNRPQWQNIALGAAFTIGALYLVKNTDNFASNCLKDISVPKTIAKYAPAAFAFGIAQRYNCKAVIEAEQRK